MTGSKISQAIDDREMWYWQVRVFAVSHHKRKWLHSVWENNGLCAVEFTMHKYRMWPRCRHVACTVRI